MHCCACFAVLGVLHNLGIFLSIDRACLFGHPLLTFFVRGYSFAQLLCSGLLPAFSLRALLEGEL